MATLSPNAASGPDAARAHTARTGTARSGTGRSDAGRSDASHVGAAERSAPLSITRRLRAAAGLPSGRAVFGGLLISASALGVIAAYRDATVDRRHDVLVIHRPVQPGAIIAAADLALAPVQLNALTEERAFVDPADVVGSTALIALEPGDLISPSMLAEAERSRAIPARTVGLSLNAEHALGDRLNVGDRVDVYSLATANAAATVLVRDARISAISTPSSGSIGSGGRLALSLDVADEGEALTIVDADSGAGVTLVRATHERSGEPES